MRKRDTEIIFLLDRSGSMAGLEKDTIGGFNSLLHKQLKLDEETKATVALFDHEYEMLWENAPAKDIKLTSEEYFVRGTTALLDAIGKTIINYKCAIENPAEVIFVITTDGMENASREFTYQKIKDLIKQKEKECGWRFIFLGANIDAIEEASQLGINTEDAYNFEATNEGVQKMYSVVHERLVEKRK